MEKVLPENLKNKLQITESYDNKVYLQETKATFLNYKIYMELTDFSQIEDAAKAMKEIKALFYDELQEVDERIDKKELQEKIKPLKN